MYRIVECVNPFCPYKGLQNETPCRCRGSGFIVKGASSVPANDRRVKIRPRKPREG